MRKLRRRQDIRGRWCDQLFRLSDWDVHLRWWFGWKHTNEMLYVSCWFILSGWIGF